MIDKLFLITKHFLKQITRSHAPIVTDRKGQHRLATAPLPSIIKVEIDTELKKS